MDPVPASSRPDLSTQTDRVGGGGDLALNGVYRCNVSGYGSVVSLTDGPSEVGVEDLLDEYARAIEIWSAALTQLRASVDYSVDLRKER